MPRAGKCVMICVIARVTHGRRRKCPNLAQEEEKLRQTTLELGLYLHVSFVKRREAMWNPLQ